MAVDMPCMASMLAGISIGAMFTSEDMVAPLLCSHAAISAMRCDLDSRPGRKN